MRPSRVTVTTIPSLGESGRASARGSSTSTPPCMIGAVIMKMIRSTSMTSTSEVTFTSAISGSSPRWLPSPPPRLADISDESFPGHGPDQLVGETFELAREEAGPIHVQVVGDHGRDRCRQAGERGHQRLGHAGGDRSEVARALGGYSSECIDDADRRAEQPQQRAHRPEGGEPGNVVTEQVPLGGHFLAQYHLERLELGHRQRAPVGAALLPERARAKLAVKRDRLAEQPVVRRRRLLHHRVIGVLQPGGSFHLGEKPVRLAVEPAKLPPLEDDDEPGDQGEDGGDDEDDLGLEAGGEHQLDRRPGHRPAGLEDHRASFLNHSMSGTRPSSNRTSGAQPSTALALPIASELRSSSPARGGANSSSGVIFMTCPMDWARSSTLRCVPVAMLIAGASRSGPGGSVAVLARTLARATSFTKT